MLPRKHVIHIQVTTSLTLQFAPSRGNLSYCGFYLPEIQISYCSYFLWSLMPEYIFNIFPPAFSCYEIEKCHAISRRLVTLPYTYQRWQHLIGC
jgi:hypothetical protein